MLSFARLAAVGTFVLAGLVTSVDAADFGKKDVVGVWTVDVVQMMKDSGHLDEMPPGMDVEALAAMMAITFTFRDDGSVQVDHNSPQGPRSEGGSWKFVGAEENRITLLATTKDPTGTEKEKTITLTFADRDQVTASWTEGEATQSMVMNRTTAKAVQTDE
jgi:hypothetical protein